MDPVAQVVVRLEQDGQVKITFGGTAANKLTLMGLLEFGKHAVMNQQEQEASPLLLARGGLQI